MKLLHKSFPLRIEVKEDAEPRTIEGWASTFGNRDSYNDIILPGAFAESIKGRKPKMLWQHDSDELIGVWDVATETAQGLYVKGRLADTPRGNEAYTLAKMGALDAMSIGYSTIEAEYDHQSGVRTLKKVDLWEVSLVTFPANDKACVTLVKAAMEDIDAAAEILEQVCGMCDAYGSGGMEPTAETLTTLGQMVRQAQALLEEPDMEDGGEGKARPSPKAVERILREAGLSRGDARGVLAKGYTAIAAPREAGGQELKELADLFSQFSNQFKR